MVEEIDIHKLAAMVIAKRGKRGLRETAKEIGEVSVSTLSRVEQGKVPDLGTFLRLCHWLGVSTEQFIPETMRVHSKASPQAISTKDMIVAHLRADRTLDLQTAEALSTMIRLAYEAASQGKLGKQTQE